MDVNLSLKLSKAVHDRCHNVPHDIGIELEQIVREHQNEQLNKLSVVRGGDSESQLVERTKRYFKYPDWVERRITPPEPLATEARDTVAEARDFRHCYIRTKIGCHCTDECGYEAVMRGTP